MSYANNAEREHIIVQALNAQTLAKIEVAAQALRQWIQDHPDDLSAEAALEPLALRRIGISDDSDLGPSSNISSD